MLPRVFDPKKGLTCGTGYTEVCAGPFLPVLVLLRDCAAWGRAASFLGTSSPAVVPFLTCPDSDRLAWRHPPSAPAALFFQTFVPRSLLSACSTLLHSLSCVLFSTENVGNLGSMEGKSVAGEPFSTDWSFHLGEVYMQG